MAGTRTPSLTDASASLTVEIVNDGDRSDDEVFLLLTATSMSVTGNITTLQLPQSTTGSVTAGALSGLDTNGTLVSSATGQTRSIYQFGVDSLVSGRLLVSFDTAIAYANNAAPTATDQSMRWDKLEFGFPAPSGADLTSIDFFGIPLQFEYLDQSGEVLAVRTFYTSTSTLLSALYDLDQSSMADAFQQISNDAPAFGWTPGTDAMSKFLRVVGPQTLTAGNQPPSPYPSFSSYLDSIVTAGTSFTLSGQGGVGPPAPTHNNVSYSYTASISSDGKGGYTIDLTGTTAPVAPNTENTPYGLVTNASGSTTAAALPGSLPVTLALSKDAFDDAIYAATANAFTVGQSSDPTAPNYLDPTLIPYSKNSVYATIAGDLISGLHFGYLDGTFGTDSATWYASPPTPYPFAGARKTNDGFYNPYAAVLYNLCDAYGFPFSDRNGRPNPFVAVPSGTTTMRVTILPDSRLDAPQVTVSASTDSTITVQWPAVSAPDGFTLSGYTLSVSPPVPATTTSVSATTTSYTLTGLASGTAYTIGVTATGMANDNAVQSHTVPITAATTGAASALTGELSFLVTLSWGSPGAVPAGAAFTINGSSIEVAGAPVTVNGSAGLNVFPISMSTTSGGSYQGNYAISLQGQSDDYQLDPSGVFELIGNSQALVAAGPPTTPPYGSAPGSQLSVGTPFSPVADKQINAVMFPSSS